MTDSIRTRKSGIVDSDFEIHFQSKQESVEYLISRPRLITKIKERSEEV